LHTQIKITRNNVAEGERCPAVYAPRFPAAREEGWWILLASTRSNQILSYGHVVATGRVCEKELKVIATLCDNYVYFAVLYAMLSGSVR
jgi:translocation protein SEC63